MVMQAARTLMMSLLVTAAIATASIFLLAFITDDAGETGCGGG